MGEKKDDAGKEAVADIAKEAFGDLRKEQSGPLLPTEKTPRKTSLADQTILIHGRPKIGKSEFCSNAPDALFIATEAGLNWLEVFQVTVSTWQEMLSVCAEIAKGEHSFKTIVIDTLDNAYQFCSRYMCDKIGIQHEGDLGFGKGYRFSNNELYRVINKLSLLPYGLFLACHSQEKEVETERGKRIQVVPNLPPSTCRKVLGMVDLILYCDVEETTDEDGTIQRRRVIRTTVTKNYEAGGRAQLPPVIDLNYNTFVAALNEGVAAAPSSKKPSLTTEAQLQEFGKLVMALELKPEAVDKRLAKLGVSAPGEISEEGMAKILVNLRAAMGKKED